LEEEEYDDQDLEENDGYQVNVSEVYESKLNIEGILIKVMVLEAVMLSLLLQNSCRFFQCQLFQASFLLKKMVQGIRK